MLKNRVDRILLSTMRPTRAWRLSPLLLAAILSGCAVNPIQEEARVLAPIPVAELNRATSLEAQGKTAEAAELYLALAAKAQPPARAQLQLKAARASLAGGQIAPAKTTVDAISRPDMTPSQRDLLLLTEADLALLTDHPKDAIGLLERMQIQTLPKELKAKRLGTLASAQRLANSPLAAAQTLNDLDRLLDQQDERLLNQVSLISTLSLIGNTGLQDLTSTGSGAMKGWAEVALLTRNAGADPQPLEARYRQWQQRHSGHPALPELASAYTGTLAGGYANGDRISILLPRGGRFAAAAKAVQDGIEAAGRADRAGQRPSLNFTDISNADRSRGLHAKAIQDGADYVIGPLQKEAVDALAAERLLGVPTLALNEATRTDKRAENLYQFSLSPENEAAEVASKAYAMGLRHALLLYPASAWGERLAGAFRRQWSHQGGTLTRQSSYQPTGASADRVAAKLLGGADADLVFLVATADMARKLHPSLQAASTKPIVVISTSHVYSGDFDPKRDAGLVGLYFVDIPWMLDVGGAGPLSRRVLSKGTDPLARLHAMGIDAYRLAPRLADLAKNPGAYYPGQTGGLSLDRLGRIQRQLELGRFTETGPRLADVTADKDKPEVR
ncbi:penicillin-binding protein activator [Thiocystis violascens]|uniref:Putative lipoprotein n=1 Tax=Thiocystis violascens (strain ATCC 17096 / DSM 198 / 6111) TaxID=765911 RepID=I3YBA8_THIV6|nr:penicillin-binding protein activator [Thiocystis violascens]AFL74276.1 putative lipoprotein [Thiocystis violascens DSM 198]